MSIVLTRSPLEAIGMNGAGVQKRRSARLSGEASVENEPPAKKAKVNGATATAMATKQLDGGNAERTTTTGKRKQRGRNRFRSRDTSRVLTHSTEYGEVAGDFHFTKKASKFGKRNANESTTRGALEERLATVDPVASTPDQSVRVPTAPAPVPEEPGPAVHPTLKKVRRRLPLTPERSVAEKTTRRSKRLSDEKSKDADPAPQRSPHKPAHASSHANLERSPSPARGRPKTVEKTRKLGSHEVEEPKVMRIALPFADTPVQRRNKEMRKTSAEGHRRSSAGMRGKRASSVIDEGRGHGKCNPVPVTFPT